MKKLFKKDQKGFTLAELLIVVAIIAVLVAISIPIFTTQLEKAREATDLANIRAAYAECAAEAITADTENVAYVWKSVPIKQTTAGWSSLAASDTVGGVAKASLPEVKSSDTVYVAVYCDGTTPTAITKTQPTAEKGFRLNAPAGSQ